MLQLWQLYLIFSDAFDSCKSKLCEVEEEALFFRVGPQLALMEYVHILAGFASREDMYQLGVCSCLNIF